MNFADKITLKTREIGSPLCLGLDPHPNLIPKLFKNDLHKLSIKNIEDFLFEIFLSGTKYICASFEKDSPVSAENLCR